MATSSLEQFVEEVSGTSHLRVEHDFGGGFVRLHTSEAERRQAAQDIKCSEDILVELLRNSRDAHATHIFVATYREGDMRTIVVIDDGDGIRPDMHEHIFEPRVTSKLDTAHRDKWGIHGRGMALFSVALNSESARVVTSDENLGCSIAVQSDSAKLPEKADQSSFPQFELEEDGKVNVRGPKNLVRNACEFGIEERSSCSVFFGSPTEIIAALYEFGIATLSAIDRAFCRNVEELPIVKRLATAGDPETLAALSESIGLPISTRTARRILDDTIQAAIPIIDRIAIKRKDQHSLTRTSPRELTRITPKISQDDRKSFASDVLVAFDAIAERYYLKADIDPTVRVQRGNLVISVPLVPQDDDVSPN